MLNFNSVLLFSEDPKKLADFYSKVFGKEPQWADSNYYGWEVGNAYLTVGPHDKVKGVNKTPERMMLNFETSDVQGEFARIKDLGAEVVAEPYRPGGEEMEGWIATFADPDGNYFQLITPMDMSN